MYNYSLTSYSYDFTIRVWYNNPYHTRMAVPYAYTRMVRTIRVWLCIIYGPDRTNGPIQNTVYRGPVRVLYQVLYFTDPLRGFMRSP